MWYTKIKFPTKIDMKILTLETGTKNYLNQKKKSYKHWCTWCTNRLIESIIFTVRANLVMKNFFQYLNTILISSKGLRMGMQKTPFQKAMKYRSGHRHSWWILQAIWWARNISRVRLKYDYHLTIYDRYNGKCTKN